MFDPFLSAARGEPTVSNNIICSRRLRGFIDTLSYDTSFSDTYMKASVYICDSPEFGILKEVKVNQFVSPSGMGLCYGYSVGDCVFVEFDIYDNPYISGLCSTNILAQEGKLTESGKQILNLEGDPLPLNVQNSYRPLKRIKPGELRLMNGQGNGLSLSENVELFARKLDTNSSLLPPRLATLSLGENKSNCLPTNYGLFGGIPTIILETTGISGIYMSKEGFINISSWGSPRGGGNVRINPETNTIQINTHTDELIELSPNKIDISNSSGTKLSLEDKVCELSTNLGCKVQVGESLVVATNAKGDTVKLEDGTIDIKNKYNQGIKVSKDGIFVSFSGITEPLVFGEKLEQLINLMITTMNGHTHPGVTPGDGSTLPITTPITPIPFKTSL